MESYKMFMYSNCESHSRVIWPDPPRTQWTRPRSNQTARPHSVNRWEK